MRWPRAVILMLCLLAMCVASPAAAQTRVEETALATTVYTGGWFQSHSERAWSGGTAAFSASVGAHATLMFIGTGVSWIGFRGPQGGIARVSLDGVQVAPQVDTYAPAEQLQAVLFSATGLTA